MNTFNLNHPNAEAREALIKFGLERTRTHWVTLNCHSDFPDETALRRLKRWRVEMLRRLHGQHWYRLPERERFEFFGSREFTSAREPHFHLACSVATHLTARFDRHAARRWKAIVPSGTCFIEVIDDDPDSPARILGYALKRYNPRCDLSFIDSRLFYKDN